ncbi:MAG: CYTH domain-containing protein [Deinococcota bacterium]
MPTEIERKFLVSPDWSPSAEVASTGVRLQQGYLLANPEKSVRVRASADHAWLTIKGASDMSKGSLERLEFEYSIPLDDAQTILNTLCQQPVIDKTRYSQDVHGLTWTIDVFTGENTGLVLAEVELEHAEQHVNLPDWVTQEVSKDGRYSNAYLAHQPFKHWR